MNIALLISGIVVWWLFGILGSSIGYTYFLREYRSIMGKGDIIFFYIMSLSGAINLLVTLLLYHTRPNFSWLIGKI